eukprot:TRINITY_DN47183_c0_g1_i1.p1 TRINITY_DN47183_c0_g1~~TRINITY_DN47183_c0_g1_i1.p1  ORF type:complete len:1065 (+),score=160.28 TRINITY_DN47183_c0_g1_i1:78-3272(+)
MNSHPSSQRDQASARDVTVVSWIAAVHRLAWVPRSSEGARAWIKSWLMQYTDVVMGKPQKTVSIIMDNFYHAARNATLGTSRRAQRMRRALIPASLYMWNIVPLKLNMMLSPGLQQGAEAPRREQLLVDEDMFAWERHFLTELRSLASTAFQTPGPVGESLLRSSAGWVKHSHYFCKTGYWLSSALSDCYDALFGGAVLTANATFTMLQDILAVAEQRGVAEANCEPAREKYSMHVAADMLVNSVCLEDSVLWHVACGLSRVLAPGRGYLSKEDLAIGLYHLEVAGMTMLICDDCRFDGLGHSGAALDDVLLLFGKLVSIDPSHADRAAAVQERLTTVPRHKKFIFTPLPHHELDFRGCAEPAVNDTFAYYDPEAPTGRTACSPEGLLLHGGSYLQTTERWKLEMPMSLETLVKLPAAGGSAANETIFSLGLKDTSARLSRERFSLRTHSTPIGDLVTHVEIPERLWSAEEFTHIVVAVHDGMLNLYMNGLRLGSVAVSDEARPTSSITALIGASRSHGVVDGFFSGTVAFVRAWRSIPLSAGDVSLLYGNRDSYLIPSVVRLHLVHPDVPQLDSKDSVPPPLDEARPRSLSVDAQRIGRELVLGRSALQGLWRGPTNTSYHELYGRPAGCPTVLRPRVCISGGYLYTSAASSPSALGTCQYERQRPKAHTVALHSWNATFNADAACELAPADKVLLAIPFLTWHIRHLSSIIIWLLPVLAWFHGRMGPKMLRALWERVGQPLGEAPERLFKETTEVALVNLRHEDGHRKRQPLSKLVGSELLALLSDRPPVGDADGCRCYDRGGVWGYLDAPFSRPGDFSRDPSDLAAVRAAIAARFPRTPRMPDPLRRRASAWRNNPGSRVRVMLVERYPRYTPGPATLMRNVSNFAAIHGVLTDKQNLAVVYFLMQLLPFTSQLYAALHEAEILVAATGASLAWTAFLRPGSYVVQMHLGQTGSPHFGTCYWGWNTNLRSEWGSWAYAARVHYGCISNPSASVYSEHRCFRELQTTAWEVPNYEVDVPRVERMVMDAASRLRGGHGVEWGPLWPKTLPTTDGILKPPLFIS